MNFPFRLIRRAAWLPLLSILVAVSAGATDLTVEVTGHNNVDGKLRVALYSDSKTFPGTPLRGVEAPAKAGTVMLTFKDVAPGAYALSAFHDENDNGKMDRGMFKIPTERYGFSRDARGDKGPPEFRDAWIDVRDASMTIAIKLH